MRLLNVLPDISIRISVTQYGGRSKNVGMKMKVGLSFALQRERGTLCMVIQFFDSSDLKIRIVLMDKGRT